MNYDGERLPDTLTLDLYPGKNMSFELYEDEGSDRGYRDGKFSLTSITAQCDKNDRVVSVTIGAAQGEFPGKTELRAYVLQIHGKAKPLQIQAKQSTPPGVGNQMLKPNPRSEKQLSVTGRSDATVVTTSYFPTNEVLTIRMKY